MHATEDSSVYHRNRLLRKSHSFCGVRKRRSSGNSVAIANNALSSVIEQACDDNTLAGCSTTCQAGEILYTVKGVCKTDVTCASTATSVTTQQQDKCVPLEKRAATFPSSNGVTHSLTNEMKVNGDTGNKWYSSFLDKKRRAFNIFGSVRRTRDRDKEARKSVNLESLNYCHRDLADIPYSPLLTGDNSPSPRRVRSGSDPHSHLLSVRPTSFLNSTGFTPPDNDLTSSLTVPSTSPRVSSCKDLTCSVELGTKKLAALRKTNSLPRSVLYSPVTFRKGQRPFSQWVGSGDIASTSTTSSPTSSVSGSREAVFSPTVTVTFDEIEPDDDHRLNMQGKGLTRSSSLPADTDLVIEPTINAQNESNGKPSGTTKSRTALRSQSFNTHTHSHVSGSQTKDMCTMREHVVRFLLETEQSYIHSLNAITQCFQEPLTHAGCGVNSSAVDEVLQQVPTILLLHSEFMMKVEQRLADWHSHECIGDLFLDTFTQIDLVEAYSRFINSFLRAKAAIELAKHTRPELAKTLGQRFSDKGGSRLSFDDLLIKPVQRIPRYMLFIKDLLKYTTVTHPDHTQLSEALEEMTALAVKVNENEKKSHLLHQLRELLLTSDGLAEVLSSNSMLVRQDCITEIVRGSVQRKTRLLLMFTDRIVCVSSRRRGNGFRRGSLMNVNSVQSEGAHHRVKWSCPIPTLSVSHSQVTLLERRKFTTLEKAIERLCQDEAVLQQLNTLTATLHTPHQHLSSAVQDMVADIRGNLVNRKREMDNLMQDSAKLDLVSRERTAPAKYTLIFHSQKDRQSWEHDLHSIQQSPGASLTANELLLSGTLERHSKPHFVSSVALPACGPTSQISAMAATPDGQQLFVCSNDSSGAGRVTILKLTNSSGSPTANMVANVPLSPTQLLCATCVTYYPLPSLPMSVTVEQFLASYNLITEDNEQMKLFPLTPASVALQDDIDTSLSSPDPLLRSISAPPKTNIVHCSPPASPSPSHSSPSLDVPVTFSYVVQDECNTPTPPPTPTPTAQLWLWLGTQSGQVYMVRVTGGGSLQLSNHLTAELNAPVVFIKEHSDRVFAGLGDGKLALFNLNNEFHHPEQLLQIDTTPLLSCSVFHHQLLIASGSGLRTFSPSSCTAELLTLHSHISCITTKDNLIYVAVDNPLSVLVFSPASKEPVTTLDCTAPSTEMNDTEYTGHYTGQIVSMVVSKSLMLIGTRNGSLMTVPLPLQQDRPPQMLSRVHSDSLSSLLAVPFGRKTLLISGGKGVKSSSSLTKNDCQLLLWKS